MIEPQTKYSDEDDEVDIEAIMQEIRRQILSKKRIGQAGLPLGGKRFSPAFYEQLYQAALLGSEFGMAMHVTKSRLPLLGPADRQPARQGSPARTLLY